MTYTTDNRMNRMLINKDKLREFSEKNDIIPSLVIMTEWVIISSIFFISVSLQHWAIYLVGAIIMSTRLYAFQSLSHEACHYHLHSNKKTNEVIAHLLVTWPIFVHLDTMRKAHLTHHRHLQTEKDPEVKHLDYPEFQIPLSKKQFLTICLKDLSGFNFVKYRWKKLPKTILMQDLPPLQRLFYTFLFLTLLYFNLLLPAIVLWLIPYMTIYQLLNRIRLYYEHFNLNKNKEHPLRTLHLSRLGAFFLAPYSLGYHAEHHLFPGIPFYNLPQLHKIISRNNRYSHSIELETNYLKMISKIIKT